MADLPYLATLEAVQKALLDALKDAHEDTRAAVRDALSSIGAASVHAELSGERIGTVTLVAGRVGHAVTDEAALLAWARANAPHAIRESVDFDALGLVASDAGWVAPLTGEVVAGVSVTRGNAYPSVRFTKTGKQAVLDSLRRGTLTAGDVLALKEAT